MLLQLFSLYFESLILTTILVLIFLGIWIGLRAMSGVDKTAKAPPTPLYDMIMIGVLVVPVLSFAVMSLILVFKA
ncbi:membrane associated protein [Streptococcus pneumoniae]|nr:membrane associated protein [Streptococcus pneumoniae]